MAKLIYASLKTPQSGRDKPKKSAIASKVVTAPDGSRLTLYTLDAESPTFGEDLTTVFKRNVAKARRENKRLPAATGRVVATA